MTIRVAESRGYAISYADAGDGPAVVLVNGFASPAAEWRKFGYVDRLADRYRVLVVDSLGHGQSAMPHDADAYRAPDAADIIAAMDAAGIGRADSGRTEAVSRFPSRVNRRRGLSGRVMTKLSFESPASLLHSRGDPRGEETNSESSPR